MKIKVLGIEDTTPDTEYFVEGVVFPAAAKPFPLYIITNDNGKTIEVPQQQVTESKGEYFA